MKKLTRKLFISILSMAFAVIAIGTTTFAWITISTTAEVNAFEASVETGAGGIELSWDEQTWTTLLDGVMEKDSTGNYKHINNEFIAFSDICFEGKTSDGYSFYDIEVNGNKANKVSAEESSYITFSFYIRNTNPAGGDVNVVVDSNKVSFASKAADGTAANGTFNPTDVTGLDEQTNLFVSNAARMMIVADGYEYVYQQNDSTNENTLGSSTNGFSHEYFVKKGNSFGTLEAPTDMIIKQASKNESSDLLCTLGASNVKVTVYIWVEGWDNECHAQILKQKLLVSLGFIVKPDAADPSTPNVPTIGQ